MRPFVLLIGIFSLIMDWPWPSRDIILAGDFNIVQCPYLDCFGGNRTGRSEGTQLVLLLTALGLEDARKLSALMDSDDRPKPIKLFSH